MFVIITTSLQSVLTALKGLVNLSFLFNPTFLRADHLNKAWTGFVKPWSN